METALLKSFATWARTALIREVAARIAAVLAPGSAERVEQAKAVAALEKAVNSAGGGDRGRAAVADKVAYTWFNRIIALRFMDANGYTGIGVVSPQAGVEVGQPEILAEAKRGVIDADVVSDQTSKIVTGLLDGTRASGDPQGEAYALLLADYCRFWNKAMPFMFEREGDFTELLIPANLLADDSVLNRSVKVLTEGVCKDVEVIGWLYQFYIAERKDEVFAGFKKNKKAGADEIPAATQLFTPHWIVRYLVENSLGRLWMLNHPTSGLVSQMDYYIAPVDEETDFLKITRPEDLKVIDPACGSGHMLTYAFDLLYAIYEEEGYSPAEIPGLILTHNLYGTEIDPRAGALAAFALTMKARAKQRTFFNKQVEPNVCVIEPISFTPDELDYLVTKDGDRFAEERFWNQFAEADTLGALIQPDPGLTVRVARHLETLDDGGEIYRSDMIERGKRIVDQATILSGEYGVVVANPPYLGGRTLALEIGTYLKKFYSDASADLYSAFLYRGLYLVRRGGYTAQVTMQSWLALQSFFKLRKQLAASSEMVCMAHMDENVMGIAFGTTATVWRRRGAAGTHPDSVAVVHRIALSDLEDGVPLVKLSDRIDAYSASVPTLMELSGSPLAYWLSEDEIRVYLENKPLSEYAETRQGLATGDNDTFLRYWWEVGVSGISSETTEENFVRSGLRWVALQKGGPSVRWFGNDEFIISYDEHSRDLLGRQGNRLPSRKFYFREGLTWSSLSREFSVRQAPAGGIFETKGSMMFFREDQRFDWLLGYLNTGVAQELMDSISPTLDYHEGPVGRLPVIVPRDEDLVGQAARRALALGRSLWVTRETARNFEPPWRDLPLECSLRESVRTVRDTLCKREDSIILIESEIDQEFRASVNLLAESFSASRKTATGLLPAQYRVDAQAANVLIVDLVSYSVGCMFGRYSLDEPGLILADQGSTFQDYLAKVPVPTFAPDADNVIPIVEGDWFEDDIVERFRQFLRTAFGEQHFEENLRFVTDSLGVKNLRDYFVKSFYKDHVQRYKKRPIYWLFSSPKGSFNALIYMHRYIPSTVSTVLNEYLREFQVKLKASLEHAERSNNAKEADRLRKILLELDEYEHDFLYPLASQNIAIDLDDGVKANYPKFGAVLKKIPGLEATQ